jgi:hypothetical protein
MPTQQQGNVPDTGVGVIDTGTEIVYAGWQWIKGGKNKGPNFVGNDNKGRGVCSGRPYDGAIAAVLTRATDDELRPISNWWNGIGNPRGEQPASRQQSATSDLRLADPSDLGWDLWGGDDCIVGWESSKQAQRRMLDLCAVYGGNGMTNGTNTQTPGTYTPPATNVTPNQGGTRPQNNNQTQRKGALDDLWTGIQNFFKGIFGGALQGATQAAQTGGAAAQGTAFLQMLLPLVFLALILWAILRD